KITADTDTNIVHFAVNGPSKNIAMWVSNGYAVAFAQHSVDTARSDLDAALTQPIADRNAAALKMASIQHQINLRQANGQDASDLQAQASVYSSQLSTAIATIQTLQTQKATLPGASQLANPADQAAQTAPTTKRNMAAGGAMGLVLGIGIIFLLEALDRRVRSSEEVSEELGLGLLARIPAPSRKLRRHDEIALMTTGGGNHAEAYRKLRVALDFANLHAKAKVIMVTSAVE